MSPHPEPPPYEAYGAYGGRPAPPARRRPSPGWFVGGALLLVLGVGLTVPAIVWSIVAFTQVEATVAGDGVTRFVQVEAGEDYLVWTRPDENPDCLFVDDATGDELPVRDLVGASYRRQVGDSSWEGQGLVGTTSSRLRVTCPPGDGSIQVGERPRVRTVVGGVLLGLVVPILMAVVGVAVLLVTAILYVVRPSR